MKKAKIKILEQNVLSSADCSIRGYSLDGKEIAESKIGKFISDYSKRKLAGKVQYQLYVEAALAGYVHKYADSSCVKVFQGTIENELVETTIKTSYGNYTWAYVPVQKEAEFTAEDDGSNDEPEEDFLSTLDTSVDTDTETDELVDEPLTGTESAVTSPVVPDQFAALELADDYFPNLNISGKLTKSSGILTATNAGGVQVEIHDDYLEINNNGDIWRIDYDIPETAFCRALREVTLRMVNEGATPDTFEIVGKSGLIYTYTEATLKVVRAETQAEHDARINSTPKTQKEIDAVTSLTVAKLWGILRKKQQALKAIMTEKNIVAARKYSVQIAEVKLIIDSINNFVNNAA